jgi:Histidine phosphatase superfamily (branch 1)
MRFDQKGRSLRHKMHDNTGPTVRLFVLARHAESSANVAGMVSSLPSRSVGLTARGQDQARQLGAQLANIEIDLAVCTRFLRTQQTVELALQARRVPRLIDAGFDEVRAVDFDGQPIETYWSWERQHAASERLPHGESMDEALLRHARSWSRSSLCMSSPCAILQPPPRPRHQPSSPRSRTQFRTYLTRAQSSVRPRPSGRYVNLIQTSTGDEIPSGTASTLLANGTLGTRRRLPRATSGGS